MPIRFPAVLFVILSTASFCLAADNKAGKESAEPMMRAPFTLTLHVDKERYYEEDIGEMPYVHQGGVYLMKGDDFGVALDIREGKISAVSYQPDMKKADVTFKFEQHVESDGSAMMMLTIQNRTASVLEMQALMTVPGKKKALETSIIPIMPGLTNFESWPHPIVKLLLHDLSVGKP